MQKQRARAQASWKAARREQATADYGPLAETASTRFVGYGTTRVEGARVLALLDVERNAVEQLPEGAEGELVLDATPFYAEAGGQVADTGWLIGPEGRCDVLDVQRPLEALTVHRIRVRAGRLAVGERVAAEVDEDRRAAIRRNHTATHLLHAALREVVGTHVKQAGSLVAPDRLRFDFSHFAALTERALADVESLVNRKVLENVPLTDQEMDFDAALGAGAMALFGEKYGDRVRVVRVGDFSLELCGGTHCARSGDVGLVKLIQERGVASGVRRIEAVTGEGALRRFREEHAIVRALEERLSVSAERLPDEVERRIGDLREAQRALEDQRIAGVRERLAQAAERPRTVAGVRFLAERVDGLRPQELRELADGLRRKLRSGVVVLGRADGPKASVLVAVTRDWTDRLPAGDLVRSLGRIIGGGGGGRPDLAEAGGKEPGRLDEALAGVEREIARRMEAER
jgi:alanyl-tRNA synthetase